ncbi:DUF7092 domain-containing protein [Bradyrhizobium sp. AZCC 1610]|uniref:DUF7092 domain-containing protein n=1 Tax=Bradyrhizobium sp. AZCC 1610 TaxID=3117020 RepID=UPI003FA5B9B2
MTMDSDAPEISKTPPANAATYFDGASSRRRAVTLQFSDRLEIIEHEQKLAVLGLCRHPPRRQPFGHAAPRLPERACAGAAGGSRQRTCGRAGLTLRQIG